MLNFRVRQYTLVVVLGLDAAQNLKTTLAVGFPYTRTPGMKCSNLNVPSFPRCCTSGCRRRFPSALQGASRSTASKQPGAKSPRSCPGSLQNRCVALLANTPRHHLAASKRIYVQLPPASDCRRSIRVLQQQAILGDT